MTPIKLNAKRILMVTSVIAEKEAVLRGLQGNPRFDVLAAGVGQAAAAAGTAARLAAAEYEVVICAGIAGGFPGKASVGSLVVADEIVAADLGVETPEGFQSLDALGFGSTNIKADVHWVDQAADALRKNGLAFIIGPVLTVSTVTGTAQSAERLAARVPGAAAEAMEGFGVAAAAANSGVPILEIRAVSNLVGPRDRSAWRIDDALVLLEKACSILAEVFV